MKKTIVALCLAVSALCWWGAQSAMASPAVSSSDIPHGGDWMIDSCGYRFNADGTCLANAAVHGTWVVRGGAFIATWDNGFVDTYDVPGGPTEFHGVNQLGRRLVLRKLR